MTAVTACGSSEDDAKKDDKCAKVTCEEGATCDPETGECVGPEPGCADDLDCPGGFCLDEQCVDRDTICATLNCDAQRGACDPGVRSCTNAQNCEQDDMNCLQGFFCADDGSCTQNQCDEAGEQCDRGVCDRATGECINAQQCAAGNDCLDGHYCIAGSCEQITSACDVCVGNQGCDYDVDALAVLCVESEEGCANTVDCIDERACRDGVCVDAEACAPDAYEPNDSTEDATALSEIEGRVLATVCAGDADFFMYDTSESDLTNGELTIRLQLPAEDIGIGNLTLRLLDSDGSEVAATQSDGEDRVELRHSVDAESMGVYYVEISDAGDIAPAGLRYELSLSFVAAAVIEACENATVLQTGNTTRNSLEGPSHEMGSTCTSATNAATEDVYQFTLQQRSSVRVTVTPDQESEARLTVALRSSCAAADSELECTNALNGAGAQVVRAVLDPGTYYVIVQGPEAETGGLYTLTYTRQGAACTPGEAVCVGEDSSDVCNHSGTNVERVICPEGCNPDTGSCNRVDGDVCSVAIEAGDGFQMSIDWTRYSNSYDPGTDGGCVADNQGSMFTQGPDAVFSIALPPGQTLHATLTSPVTTPATNRYAALYLLNDCQSMDAGCLGANRAGFRDSNDRYVESLTFENSTEGIQNLFMVADSGFSYVRGPADLEISIGELVCAPAAGRCVGDVREVCNIAGTGWSTDLTCPFGCDPDTNACNTPTNDSCDGGLDIIAAGGSFSGNLADFSISDIFSSGQCPGASSASGRGAAFFVEANEGDRVVASMTSTFDGVLWVATSCDTPRTSCLRAADSVLSNNTERISFIAEATGTYHFIASAYSSSTNTGTFTFTADVQSPDCTPGTGPACSDDDTLQLCDDGFTVTYNCQGGCEDGRCLGGNGNTCFEAIDIMGEHNGTYAGTTTPASDAYTPGTETCHEASSTGRDLVFRVAATEGARVTARFNTVFGWSMLWAASSCANINGTCMDSVYVGAGTPGPLVIISPHDGDIFIVVDGRFSSDHGNFSLTVTVEEPVCETPGMFLDCSDDTTMQYCGEGSFPELYTCKSTCTDGLCDEPRGDICLDVVSLEDGDTYAGTLSGHTNRFNPGTETCIEGSSNEQNGRDAVFAIELQADEILEAELNTSSSSMGMYVIEECFNVMDVSDVCLFARPRSKRLEFHAAEAGTYYLVVDSTSTFDQAAFSLSVSTREGVCQPGSGSCDEDTDTLTLCNSDGSEILDSIACDHGCNGASCAGPEGPNNSCLNHYAIDGSIRIQDSFSRFQDNYSVQTDSCVGNDRRSPGPDAVYKVVLEPGESLVASVSTPGGASSTHVVYISTNCADVSFTCLDGGAAVNGVARAGHLTEVGEEVYVIVDSTSSTASGSFILDLDIRLAECFSEEDNFCASETTVSVCNEYGQFDDIRCNFGCDEGLCQLATNNTIDGALDAGQGLNFTGDIVDYTDNYNPADPEGDEEESCTGAAAPGPDSTYYIDAEVNDFIRVTYTAGWTKALWITTDPEDLEGCVAGVAGSGELFIEHEVTEAGRYYIIADAIDEEPTGEFTVDIEVFQIVCGQNDLGCAGDELVVCENGFLSEWLGHACRGGCNEGRCGEPTGNICQDFIEATGGGTFTEVTGNLTNNFQPGLSGSTSCTGFLANGPDAVYRVELTAGQTLDAVLDQTDDSPNIDLSLYLVTDCFNSATTCLTGEDTGSNPEVISFVADSDMVVWVIADHWSQFANSEGEYELVITITD